MEENKKTSSSTTTMSTTMNPVYMEQYRQRQAEKERNRRTKIILDKKGDFAIQFEWQHNEQDLPHWVDFKIMRACSGPTQDTNALVFYNYDLGRGVEEKEHNLDDFDEYYDEENELGNGFIKWDGCMELHNINYHFCYYDNILDRITQEVYRQAAEIMEERFEGTII